MLVFDIGDVIALTLFCGVIGFWLVILLIANVIRFFDWIRRKRK